MSVVIIDTIGTTQLRERLDSIAGRIEFAAPALELIVEDMQRVEEQVFVSQGRRGGGSWKQLTLKTQEAKAQRGESPLILIGTGDLMESVTESTGKYSDVVVTNNSIQFGTSHPGARSMQYGDPKRGIPARPFLRFTPFDRARWRRIILDYFMGRID